MENEGLACRQLPTHKDFNCLFLVINDQLNRLERVSLSAWKMRPDPVKVTPNLSGCPP